MKLIIKGIKIISILFLTLAFFVGCEEDDDNQLPAVEAGFTHTINQDTGTVTFINTSTNADSYAWDFGDDTGSTEINPIHTYTSGTYTVVLEATNVAGASDTFEDVITINISEVLALPLSFDNPLVTYEATTFNGAAFEVVENPDPSGSNPTVSNVASIVNSGAAFEGLFFDLGTPLDLSEGSSIKMNFWSETAIDVLLKLEEGTGDDVETTASHGGTGWEEITFTFTSASSYSRFTIFADGPGTNPGTFYMDDIAQMDGGNTGGDCTAETEQSLSAADFNLTFQNDPTSSIASDGAGFAWVDNPDTDNTVNMSCKVGQIDRTSASMFANNQIDLDAKLDFDSNTGFKLKVWSPTASTNVLLKLEDQANAGTFVEVSATTSASGAGQWEELTFDFASGDSNKFDKIVFFFELGTATQETYFIDDLALMSDGGTGATCVPETEQSLSAADFNLSFQNDPTSSIVSDGAGFAWIDNPDVDNSVNTSCKVGQIDRTSASMFANNQIDLDAKLDFTSNTGFKLKVWSPTASTNVLLKLEDQANAGTFVEVSATTSAGGAGQWEELTFNFTSGDSNKFDKIVLFFQLGTATQETYFIDDLMLISDGGGTGGMCVPETAQSLSAADFDLTFQNDPTASIVSDGAGFAWIDNPDFDNSVNTSCKVGQIDRTSASMFANNQIDLDAKLDFDSNTGFKLKVWSPTASTSVLLKLEDQANAGTFVEVFATTSAGSAGQWEELTFNFASGDSNKFDKIVLFFELGTATQETYYIDDLTLFSDGGGTGGGGCAGTAVGATAFPVNFEGCESFISTFTDGGSITTELADNPSMTGINTSDYVLKVDKASGTNRWAGFQNPFPSNFDATLTFKVKVYSSKANVVMKFEVNSDPQDPASGNPGPQYVTIPNANTWTEVEVLFTGIPGNNTGLNQFVIKPDNPDGTDGEVTSSNETYYFDDIRLE